MFQLSRPSFRTLRIIISIGSSCSQFLLEGSSASKVASFSGCQVLVGVIALVERIFEDVLVASGGTSGVLCSLVFHILFN